MRSPTTPLRWRLWPYETGQRHQDAIYGYSRVPKGTALHSIRSAPI